MTIKKGSTSIFFKNQKKVSKAKTMPQKLSFQHWHHCQNPFALNAESASPPLLLFSSHNHRATQRIYGLLKSKYCIFHTSNFPWNYRRQNIYSKMLLFHECYFQSLLFAGEGANICNGINFYGIIVKKFMTHFGAHDFAKLWGQRTFFSLVGCH